VRTKFLRNHIAGNVNFLGLKQTVRAERFGVVLEVSNAHPGQCR